MQTTDNNTSVREFTFYLLQSYKKKWTSVYITENNPQSWNSVTVETVETGVGIFATVDFSPGSFFAAIRWWIDRGSWNKTGWKKWKIKRCVKAASCIILNTTEK